MIIANFSIVVYVRKRFFPYSAAYSMLCSGAELCPVWEKVFLARLVIVVEVVVVVAVRLLKVVVTVEVKVSLL